MSRNKRAHAPSDLSADQLRALERLLETKVRVADLLPLLLKDRAVLDLLLRKAAAEERRPEQVALTAVQETAKQQALEIPITLISQQQIGGLEAICQYLRTRALTYAQIGRLLNRDARTIWASCQTKTKIAIPTDALLLPLAIFADRRFSILESAVAYLRETKGYKPFQIAELLSRDQRVMATIWHRAMRKRGTSHGTATANERTEVGR